MIYLDSAATTFQKPQTVRQAVLRAMEQMSSPGRGGYHAAQAAEATLFRCRSLAAELFDVPSAEQVTFTSSATHGLNIAIKTLVSHGGHVLISGYEHNAVTRPLHALNAKIEVATSPLFQADAMLRAFEKKIRPDLDAVICTHVSNVFGFVLPIDGIAALCQRNHIPLIIDASQSAGILPLSVRKLGAAFVAMPGHKGLYGPQGTGILLCNHAVTPLLEGGTGSESIRQEMPEFLPDRLEAGTANVPGISGLLAGLQFVQQKGERIAKHERALILQAAYGLQKFSNIEEYTGKEHQVGVLSFTVDGKDATEVADMLAEKGVAVRGGLHCAPLAHETVGTLPDGTVRLSVSAFNHPGDIDDFLRIMRQIAKK